MKPKNAPEIMVGDIFWNGSSENEFALHSTDSNTWRE